MSSFYDIVICLYRRLHTGTAERVVHERALRGGSVRDSQNLCLSREHPWHNVMVPAQWTCLHTPDACPHAAGVREAEDAVLLAWHDRAMALCIRGTLQPGLTEVLL